MQISKNTIEKVNAEAVVLGMFCQHSQSYRRKFVQKVKCDAIENGEVIKLRLCYDIFKIICYNINTIKIRHIFFRQFNYIRKNMPSNGLREGL